MNRTRNQIPRNKLLAIVLLVGVIGYVLARPSLERWWGISLPSLTETVETTKVSRPATDGFPGQSPVSTTSDDQAESDWDQDPVPPTKSKAPAKPDPFQIPAAKKPTPPPKTPSPKTPPAQFELKKLERGRLQSPAGLIYSPGPQGEHRVDHVLRHAKDEPGRPKHGVFSGSRDEILQLLDEAFLMINQNSRQVSRQADGDRIEYTIRFDRAIGYEGGRSGMRNNFPRLNRLRLVLEDGNDVVTAYPVQ